MKMQSAGAITRSFFALSGFAFLAACGGGGSSSNSNSGGGTTPPTASDIAYCDSTDFQSVLSAVPVAGGGTSTPPAGSLRIHYNRTDATYTGWQTYVYNAPGEALGAWPGKAQTGSDSFGAYWDIPVTAASLNFIIHNGDTNREPSNWAQATADRQQFWAMADGAEIWKLSGDATNYTSNPLANAPKDLTTVRVHYKRSDGLYNQWGLHLWNGGGLDTAALPGGVTINDWNNPVAFSALNGYSVSATEVVFNLPVLNPKDDSTREKLEFILHGMPGAGNPGPDNKDGRTSNIEVKYSALSVANQVADVWLLEGDATVYAKEPDTRVVSTTDARAYWLTKQLLQWPKLAATGTYKLYYSAKGQIVAAKDAAVTGADGSLTLTTGATVPADVVQRFKYVASGVVLSVKDADLATLADLHTNQLVLVQENSDGKVQNATTAQIAGALDDQFGGAQSEAKLGAVVAGGSTSFKLWAPTAQKVQACVYDAATGKASSVEAMQRDAATGIWSVSKSSDLSGKYFTYLVDVFVRGVGVVRNRVSDPYSQSLSADSARSYVADLEAASLKPDGWDAAVAPTLAAQEDMSIYELHVRDFSINDSSVPADHRGKYLAFTDENANGMKHLKGLATAGLTDVHLLPVYDFGSVPEVGCKNPEIAAGASDSTAAREAINAIKDEDCFNWGYDPVHYTSPEGSYSTNPNDGAARIREFRQMVMALHKAGLRVGMDVVYNHTFASGQKLKSILDRIVPGYYHRLDDAGVVANSTCCDNTATENAMMGKLMIDSVKTWATQYKIDSFRFDLMGHQPRAVMEQLKTEVKAAAGRDVFLIGEGWNYGEVANGARFVQASQLSLNGSGIGTFSDRARDRIRGGGCCDDGASFRAQGYVTGLFYDPNETASGQSASQLMDYADIIRVGLSGSLRNYQFETRDGSVKKGEDLSYGSDPAGYVTDPQEVVNYYENHDNRTFWDAITAKLPKSTSLDDRVRVQSLAAAINSFSQGVAYFHAGSDVLRSKSMDNNSYNSGDWFNRLDWTYTSNNFGVGLPVSGDQTLAGEFLAANVAASYTPSKTQIETARDMFRDLLAIRKSSQLFRMRTSAEVEQRLKFYNTGASQEPTVLVGHLNGVGYTGANFKEVMYFINVDKQAHSLTIADELGKAYVLHPVQVSGTDRRPANDANYNPANGTFTIPPRSTVVYVVN